MHDKITAKLGGDVMPSLIKKYNYLFLCYRRNNR